MLRQLRILAPVLRRNYVNDLGPPSLNPTFPRKRGKDHRPERLQKEAYEYTATGLEVLQRIRAGAVDSSADQVENASTAAAIWTS